MTFVCFTVPCHPWNRTMQIKKKKKKRDVTKRKPKKQHHMQLATQKKEAIYAILLLSWHK